MNKIKYAVIHCSATNKPEQLSFDAVKHLHTASPEEEIKWGNYDTRGNGWSDIGYHYYIERSGEIKKGRHDNVQGAHCIGYNDCSISICLAGLDEFTHKQIGSLMTLIKELRLKYGDFILCGHCDLDDKKTCPNFNVRKTFGGF
jgi:N-acetyl-anhydromuramyl-L-alanine amidase AmpD